MILAAGESRRMGQPKQLLAWKGTTLLRHTVAQARGLAATVLVVLGPHYEQLRDHLGCTGVYTTYNDRYSTGMASSIACGVQALVLIKQRFTPLIIMLADQPEVDTAYLQRLNGEYQQFPESIIATAYESGPGVPALFPPDDLAQLMTLPGEAGAGAYLRSQGKRVRQIQPVTPFFDLDTPQDYRWRHEGD